MVVSGCPCVLSLRETAGDSSNQIKFCPDSSNAAGYPRKNATSGEDGAAWVAGGVTCAATAPVSAREDRAQRIADVQCVEYQQGMNTRQAGLLNHPVRTHHDAPRDESTQNAPPRVPARFRHSIIRNAPVGVSGVRNRRRRVRPAALPAPRLRPAAVWVRLRLLQKRPTRTRAGFDRLCESPPAASRLS